MAREGQATLLLVEEAGKTAGRAANRAAPARRNHRRDEKGILSKPNGTLPGGAGAFASTGCGRDYWLRS